MLTDDENSKVNIKKEPVNERFPHQLKDESVKVLDNEDSFKANTSISNDDLQTVEESSKVNFKKESENGESRDKLYDENIKVLEKKTISKRNLSILILICKLLRKILK